MSTYHESRAELLAAASRGDARAFDSLFRRHIPALVVFLRTRLDGALARRESAHDLAQSVCREALQDWHDFEYRGEEAFRAWLFLLANRKLVDRHRFHTQQKRDVRISREPLSRAEAEVLAAQYASVCTPSRQVSAQEEVARIESGLLQLTEAQREAILLARVGELSCAEIARQKGCDESAVRGLIARGLARLSLILNRGD